MQFNYLCEKLILEEYDYSCVMLSITGDTKQQMIDFAKEIYDYDLAEGKGREMEPHITILFGIHTSDFGAMEKVLKQYKKPTVDFTFTGVSVFRNKDNHVLKFDVESEDLEELNELFKQMEHTSTFPEYHPHATIAYIKNGYAEEYVNPSKLDNIQQTSNVIRLSNPDGQEKIIKL